MTKSTLRRWAPLAVVLAIAAPFALVEAPSSIPLLAWGVAKVAAFGALGIVLDRFAAPYCRPHTLRDEVLWSMGKGKEPAELTAARMRSFDAANMRRAVTMLGCQIAGALL